MTSCSICGSHNLDISKIQHGGKVRYCILRYTFSGSVFQEEIPAIHSIVLAKKFHTFKIPMNLCFTTLSILLHFVLSDLDGRFIAMESRRFRRCRSRPSPHWPSVDSGYRSLQLVSHDFFSPHCKILDHWSLAYWQSMHKTMANAHLYMEMGPGVWVGRGRQEIAWGQGGRVMGG